MQIHRKIWYWILQITSWGSIATLNTYGKLSVNDNFVPTYIFIEGILFFLAGIIATSLLRHFLKKRVDFNAFRSKDYKTTFGGYVLFSLVFFVILLIAKPFYDYFHATPWAFSGIVLVSNLINAFVFILLWLVIYLTVKLFIAQNKNKIKRLELENALKESELNTLKGQINPHFMFNCMNNIRGLMLEDVEKSREMLTRLSDLLRYSLSQSKVDVIPLEDELEMVDNYISLSKIHLEDRLTYEQEVDPDLYQEKIPPMLIQMLIENSIKHGIANLPQGGVVRLSINKTKDTIQIQVKNSGKIMKEKETTQVGLQNIKKRLELIYVHQAKFSLQEQDNEVVATITIPRT